MAENKPVTEPAKPETAAAKATETVRANPYELVRVRDKQSKEVQPRPVPRTWLDGRFPNLEEVPSTKKEGK